MADGDPPAGPSILVCFAVKEEAKFFQPEKVSPSCKVLVTGMGKRNAERNARTALDRELPELVVTAGFAGGLNPGLALNTIVFDSEDEQLTQRLISAGAVRSAFHCADRVAVTAAEKAELCKASGADAVEMESGVIRAVCRERQVASATVRAISDAAGDDLPLDFNALMNANDEIDYLKLARTVAFAPGRIPALLRFQRQTNAAALALADALHRSLGGRGR